jgi:ABC-2 type transport system permease protein
VNFSNVWKVLLKDLRLGPRSPVILWAFVLPLVMTALVRGVFGGLFEAAPRLGIVDLGASEVTAGAQELEGLRVHLYDDAVALRQAVEANDLDGGLVLPAGFDETVRRGDAPDLELFVGGESLASDRIMIEIAVLDLIRGLSEVTAPVAVDVVTIGEAGLPFDLRMLPVLVMYAVAIGGAFAPAMSLVGEKESGSVSAVLVTPVTIHEFMAAKVLLGVVLATLTGVVTLLLNGAMGSEPLGLLLALVIGAAMMAEIGVMLGAWARDANTMFAAFKGGAILIFYPVIFYIWPDLPTWIARLSPTYYFLDPIFALSVEGASFGDVVWQLFIGAAVVVLLVPLVRVTGRRLERRLGSGLVETGRGGAPEEAEDPEEVTV